MVLAVQEASAKGGAGGPGKSITDQKTDIVVADTGGLGGSGGKGGDGGTSDGGSGGLGGHGGDAGFAGNGGNGGLSKWWT